MRRLVVGLALLLLCAVPAQVQAQAVVCGTTVGISAAAATVLAVPASSGRVVVCGLVLSQSAAGTVTLTAGTGTTCGTGTTTIGTFTYVAAALGLPAAIVGSPGALVTSKAGDQLCITPSAGTVTGFITFGFN